MLVTNPVTHITSIVTNGSASFTFSGAKLTNAGPITFQTFFFFAAPGLPIGTQLAGNPFDAINPSISSWVPGTTSATITFYQNTPDSSGNPHYAVVKTLKISWANNILSGSLTGQSGALGSERLATGPSPFPSPFFFPIGLGFGNSFQTVSCIQVITNKVASGFPLNSGSAMLMSDYIPPTITISSPAPNISTNNPAIEVTGTLSDNQAILIPQWRLAAPTDDPSKGANAFMWNTGTATIAGSPKRTPWTAQVSLAPGTNWFWASGRDLAQNVSSIVTRKFFYSTRSPLTLSTNGNGTITGGKGVTNGAMLEVGRGYTVTAKPNDTNTVFRDWSNGVAPISTLNPWNFQMQSNMNIVGEFIPNPFPAIVGTYSGLFYDPTSPVSPGNSGYITITVQRDGTYSGSVLFGTQRLPIHGKLFFDIIDQSAWKTMFAIGKTHWLSGQIRFPTDGSPQGNLLPTPTVTMTISNHTFVPLPLTLASNVVPAGLYNMSDGTLLPTPPTNSIGCSYGSFIVTSNGNANVVLHMADGTAPAVTFSGPVGVDGSVQFFIPLYKGKGLVIGSVNVNSGSIANTRGNANYWMKLPNSHDRYFPDGFNNAMNWGGVSYSAASFTGVFFLENLGITRIDIRTKDLDIVTDGIYVPSSNTFIIPPWQSGGTMNLKFNPKTGLITGNLNVNGNAVSNINILVGWPNNLAYGYAMGPSNSAGIIISKEGPSNIDSYDDGFVRPDVSGLDLAFGCTGYFDLFSSTQIISSTQLVLHKTIGIAAFESFEITDTYDSIDVQLPSLYPPLPFPPTPGPYVGVYNPTPFSTPAVMLTPSQRTTQYIEVIH